MSDLAMGIISRRMHRCHPILTSLGGLKVTATVLADARLYPYGLRAKWAFLFVIFVPAQHQDER